jgi:subtilase family serine protease
MLLSWNRTSRASPRKGEGFGFVKIAAMRKSLKIAALAASAAITACSNPASQPSLPGSTQAANGRVAAPITSGNLLVRRGASPNTPSGYGPSDLQAAYNLPSSTEGSGQVVAVVDAYDNPNVSSDLALYRSTYGLPAAKFTKYNQTGQTKNYPQGNSGWGIDIDLEVEMISASCPNCTIDLIEATSSSVSDIEQAESEAVALGAHIVSNGYAGTGFDQSYFDVKGVTYLASSGDGGYGSVLEPSAFGSVVAVGGTTLTRGGGGSRGWKESVWPDVGNGCTTFPKPPWQHDKTCAYRLANDVSAVADPSPGVAEYDSFEAGGWFPVGGTSVPTPLLAGIFGLAGNGNKQDGGRTFWQTAHHQYLYRLKSGDRVVRYSDAGGWGSPDGVGAF